MTPLIRSFCILLIIHLSFPGYSQDTAWKTISVTPDLAVSLPEPVYTMDTAQMKIFSSKVTGYTFQVRYFNQKYVVQNGDQLIQAYDGFLHGYLNAKEISPYTNTVVDTSFNGTTGEWVHSTSSRNNNLWEMYSYVVLVNSHFYMVTIAADQSTAADKDSILSRYYASIQFPHQPIKEYSGDFPLQARSYRRGQHIAQFVNAYLPYFLLIAVAILVIWLVYAKFIRKKKPKQAIL